LHLWRRHAHSHLIPDQVGETHRRARIFAWYDDYGDISRDAAGHMIFEGDRVKSRNGAPTLKPEDFARFGPAAPGSQNAARTSPPAPLR